MCERKDWRDGLRLGQGEAPCITGEKHRITESGGWYNIMEETISMRQEAEVIWTERERESFCKEKKYEIR